MRPATLISPLLLLAASVTAWPTGWGPFGSDKRDIAPLVVKRQSTSSKFNLSGTEKQGNTATTEASQSASGSNAKTTDGGKSTGTNKGTTSSKYQTTKTFDARLPAGGVSMITPGPFEPSQYYKIQDYVTFAWNYTSLSITPSAVDIIASCSVNSATYTIAMNQSISGETQAVTWDTGAYQATATIPLLVETYTLIIYDAGSSPDATARPGYLGTYNQFTFGMYTPQPYTPMADYVCATCNAAMGSTETRHTLGFLLGMVTLTVLSFGWFAGAAGVF